MEKCPEARRLQTHPGVGALTAAGANDTRSRNTNRLVDDFLKFSSKDGRDRASPVEDRQLLLHRNRDYWKGAVPPTSSACIMTIASVCRA